MPSNAPLVFVVGHDPSMHGRIADLVCSWGYEPQMLASGELLLDRLGLPRDAATRLRSSAAHGRSADGGRPRCAVVDFALAGLNGIALHRQLDAAACLLPTILLSGPLTARAAAETPIHGIFRVLPKPPREEDLALAVHDAIEQDRRRLNAPVYRVDFEHRLQTLDARERRTLELIVAGHGSRSVERQLGLSTRTVDRIRASLLAKMGFLSFVELSAAYGASHAPTFAPPFSPRPASAGQAPREAPRAEPRGPEAPGNPEPPADHSASDEILPPCISRLTVVLRQLQALTAESGDARRLSPRLAQTAQLVSDVLADLRDALHAR